MNSNKFIVASYYKFQTIKNLFSLKNKFIKIFKEFNIKGIILIAPEGINFNVSFKDGDNFKEKLKLINNINQSDIKYTYHDTHIFRKLKIKVKRQILTTRHEEQINPRRLVGKYIKPESWDQFINDPDVLLVDTRNFYEIEIGSFQNSINPNCRNFTEIISWLEKSLLNREDIKRKKIAMFCTGGIRCEKATSLIKIKGHKEVYHLEGGIINYLENNKRSKVWNGECFVFDDRVSIKSNMKKGTYEICYACRMPINKKDKELKSYKAGISCKHCHTKKTKKQLNKYRLRHDQLLKNIQNA